MKNKKGVMNQIIGVFILVLVVSLIAGMTFLFTAQLKTTSGAMTNQRSYLTATNESLTTVTETGEDFATADYNNVICSSVVVVNGTGGYETIASGNYTVSGCSIAFASGGTAVYNNTNWIVNYSYNFISGEAWEAINDTEGAGMTIVDYLPLLFLAIIFGVILIVVLRVLLPYINLGNQMNMGF